MFLTTVDPPGLRPQIDGAAGALTTFGGHSLRAGFLTNAAERGKPLDRMMALSRHKRVDTVLGYVRRARDFDDHAGAGLL